MSNTDPYVNFSKISTGAWEDLIRSEIKDEKALEMLTWLSPEGIAVKPFYHFDTHQPIPFKTKQRSWKIAERVDASELRGDDPLKNIPNSGVDALVISELDQLQKLPEDIAPEISIHLEAAKFTANGLEKISQGRALPNKLHLQVDILGNLAATGNWMRDEHGDWTLLGEIIRKSTATTVLSVDVGCYQNAGASIVQQLGLAIAHANEYLHFISENSLGNAATNLVFKIATGSNYFFEIAKIKALRWMWHSLCNTYGYSGKCLIFAEPTSRNKTFLDYNVNMLRTTTECMAAIIGGADVICNHSYDKVYSEVNEFGARIARNQLLILKHESYFDKVHNPADGSYYLDYLTRQLAEEGLLIFKNIEASGGFLKGLKSGAIQRDIEQQAAIEEAQLKSGEIHLTGVTDVKSGWVLPPKINPEVVRKKMVKKEVVIAPIMPSRLAQKIENKILDHG